MHPRIEENGIVFEVEVGRDEALATLELYKQICPGQSSLSSLQGVLQAMDKGGVSTHTHTQTLNCLSAAGHTKPRLLTNPPPSGRAALVSGLSRSKVSDKEWPQH